MDNADDAPIAPLFERTHIIAGDDGVRRLMATNILVAGMGGVGSYAAESLARMGIGRITLVDHDVVSASNLNRQLIALHSTIGEKKVAVMAERIADINPGCELTIEARFLRAEDLPTLLDQRYDYVIDAIDSINSKLSLLVAAFERDQPLVSSMGAGGRTDPTQIRVTDLMDSHTCPLAKVVRQRLRRRGHGRGITAVWSMERPRPPLPPEPMAFGRPRAVNGTVSYMPALFGLNLVGVVMDRLLKSISNNPVAAK